MSAPTGNRFWKFRSKSGRDKIFSSPSILWEESEKYFEWVEDNPLIEQKTTQFQGEFIHGDLNKMRPMTITGLCRFLHISFQTWEDYKTYDDFIEITREIEGVIYDQKFAGAAADLLNSNLIARELGLSDKKDYNINSNLAAEDLTDEQLASIAATSSKGTD